MSSTNEDFQLSQLGLSPYECLQFGSLFRDLAVYMTQLSSKKPESVGDTRIREKELLAKKSLIGIVPPTKEEIKQKILERLSEDLKPLEYKKLQLEMLKSSIDADIATIDTELAKLKMIISYIQCD